MASRTSRCGPSDEPESLTVALLTVVPGPDGRHYAIFIAPPGSALDHDGVRRGGLLGLVIGAFGAARGAASTKWRIVVQEHSGDGRLGPTVTRSAVSTEAEAHAMVRELVQLVQSGEAIDKRP